MLLGKRPRPPIKRTTSMSGITNVESSDPSDHHHHHAATDAAAAHQLMNFGHNNYDQQRMQRNNSRSSNEFMETAHFLRACGLCKRRLAPGKDIYMYRGDTGFCSLECREQLMKQDEEKRNLQLHHQ